MIENRSNRARQAAELERMVATLQGAPLLTALREVGIEYHVASGHWRVRLASGDFEPCADLAEALNVWRERGK